jgi:hypothetical protein
MKQHFWMLAVFFFASAHAQEPTGGNIPANERYVSYADIPANRVLFEKDDPDGFYTILQAAVTEAVRSGSSGLRGIAPEDVNKIKKVSEYTLGEQVAVPMTGRDGKDSVIHHPDGIEEYVYPARDTIWQDIGCRFGEQVTVPLTRRDGKDSINYLPDGTTEYVYPVREMTWYASSRFDEIVVREQLRTDPVSKKEVYVPVELLLRRKLPTGKPVVTLSLDTDVLHAHERGKKVQRMLADHSLSYTVLPAAMHRH